MLKGDVCLGRKYDCTKAVDVNAPEEMSGDVQISNVRSDRCANGRVRQGRLFADKFKDSVFLRDTFR